MKKSKNILIVIGIALGIALIGMIVFLIVKDSKTKKITDNIVVAKENYKINEDTIDIDIEIKNTSKKEEHLDSIVIKVLDDKKEEVVYLLKRIDQDVKAKSSISIQEELNTKYSNLDKNEKITFNYELQKNGE